MGHALRRLEARKAAQERLRKLVESPENVVVTHYSCESFFGRTDGTSPRVCSIAVRGLASGQTASFSIHQIAERQRVPLEEIPEKYDQLERVLLDEFYQYVGARTGYRWVHWNMTSDNYGFPALAHRHRVLGGSPVDIPESQLIDLAGSLKSIYGHDYMQNPRLNSLVTRNSLKTRDYLTGSEEAYAIEAGKYIDAHQSTQSKVYILSEILQLTADGALKTNASFFDVPKLGLAAAVERVRESLIIRVIAIIAMILGLLAAILDLAGVL